MTDPEETPKNAGTYWRKQHGLLHRVYINAECKERLKAVARALGLSSSDAVLKAVEILEASASLTSVAAELGQALSIEPPKRRRNKKRNA